MDHLTFCKDCKLNVTTVTGLNTCVTLSRAPGFITGGLFSLYQTHLFVEPASHNHWDVEVSFNSMIPLAKTVYFPCTSGALQKAKKNQTSSLCGSFAEESCKPIYCAYLR